MVKLLTQIRTGSSSCEPAEVHLIYAYDYSLLCFAAAGATHWAFIEICWYILIWIAWTMRNPITYIYFIHICIAWARAKYCQGNDRKIINFNSSSLYITMVQLFQYIECMWRHSRCIYCCSTILIRSLCHLLCSLHVPHRLNKNALLMFVF